ncbi:MAG: hypothetical protein WD872_17280 [Pirellulaceae bacterium]
MKYTVVTTTIADYQLAAIWLYASNRQQVADAFDRLEASLKLDAHLQGRHHPDGWRVTAHSPIVITFRVSEPDRLATILSVHYRP